MKYLEILSLKGNKVQAIENLDELSELKWLVLSKN